MTKRELDDAGFRLICQMTANNLMATYPGVWLWTFDRKAFWRSTIIGVVLGLAICAAVVRFA